MVTTILYLGNRRARVRNTGRNWIYCILRHASNDFPRQRQGLQGVDLSAQ